MYNMGNLLVASKFFLCVPCHPAVSLLGICPMYSVEDMNKSSPKRQAKTPVPQNSTFFWVHFYKCKYIEQV